MLRPLLLVALAACSSGQTRGHPFDAPFSDQDGSELAAFQRSWKPSPPIPRPSVAIGVVSDRLLVGRTVGRPVWRFEHPIEGRPAIAGDVVVTMGDGRLIALDSATGEMLWELNALGRLRGAGDDGRTTIVSIESLTGSSSIVLAVARDGRVIRQIYERAVVGSPAVVDDFAFLPWNDDTVVIFDLVEGSEVARVLSSMRLSRAFVVDGQVYFGEHAALRFDDRIVAARRGGGTRVALPKLVVDAPWMTPGSEARPTHATRDDRIAYYARPRDGAHIDRYALSYERLALGLDGKGKLSWVRVANDTFLGGYAARDSLALCDASGNVRWLDLESGQELHRASLGSRVIACAVESDRAPRKRATRGESLARELTVAIGVRDARLVPLQLELLDELFLIAGNESSAGLVELASSSTPGREMIASKAAELVGRRRSGADALLNALARAATPPHWWQLGWYLVAPRAPVAAIARALAQLGDARAAPLLAALVVHPALSSAEVEALAESLAVLATERERWALTALLAQHGCHPRDARLAQAVLAVARALVRLGARKTVLRVATEACDAETMRTSLLAAAASP